jgi:hypothetical protein
MSVELKVKSKHLSEEARIIRFEEHKFRKQVDWLKLHQQPYENEFDTMMSLKDHRRKEVRNENRATFLARAYLAGKEYKAVEAKRYDEGTFVYSILPRVCDMVNKYGPTSERLVKKWNVEKKRSEYDPKEWNEFKKKIAAWAEI